MAVAFDVVDSDPPTAVRTKGTRQRVRYAAGGSRSAVESFGLTDEQRERQRRREKRRSYDRLNRIELEELRDLWGMYDCAIGQRSIHGAVEARLLRAQPRDEARGDVLTELHRAGGRMPEGALLRIIAAEKGLARTYEVRRAIEMLVTYGKVERVRAAEPTYPKDSREREPVCWGGKRIENVQMLLPPDRLTDAQREYTGWDIRIKRADAERGGDDDDVHKPEALVHCTCGYAPCPHREAGDLTMQLALHSVAQSEETKRERSRARKEAFWRKQDEELEASWREVYCSDDQSGSYASADAHDGLNARQRASMERATNALALIVPTHRLVLRRFYFENRDRHAQHRFEWAQGGDELLCVAEFTERARFAARLVRAASVFTLLRQRERDEDWLKQLRRDCDELVDDSSNAYKRARRSIAVA